MFEIVEIICENFNPIIFHFCAPYFNATVQLKQGSSLTIRCMGTVLIKHGTKETQSNAQNATIQHFFNCASPGARLAVAGSSEGSKLMDQKMRARHPAPSTQIQPGHAFVRLCETDHA